jgi:hypothetical protein
VLVVMRSSGDPMSDLAAKDILASFHDPGVLSGFLFLPK